MPDKPSSPFAFQRSIAAILAVCGWASLVASVVMNAAKLPSGTSLAAVGAIVWDLARYFTILTNTLMALAMTASALQWRRGGHRFQGAVALYAALLCLLYHFLLGGAHGPLSWWLVIDLAHHYVLPAAVVLFWLAFESRQALAWGDVLRWLLYPLAYIVYMLIRGRWTGHYPYTILDPHRIGVWGMFSTCLMLTGAFLLGGFTLVAGSKVRARRR